MTQLLEDLKAVRELLSEESRWTTAAAARDVSGKPVYPLSPAAVKWCVLGALQKVIGLSSATQPTSRWVLGCEALQEVGIEHAEVIALLDKAIRKEALNALAVADEELGLEY